jgi:hypothetical protein
VGVGSGDGAGREEVAGAQCRAVAGEVGELLSWGPVVAGEGGFADLGAVEFDAQAEVVAPVVAVEVGQRDRVLQRRGDARLDEGVEGDDPRGDGGGEGFAEERTEGLVFPGLDVAG